MTQKHTASYSRNQKVRKDSTGFSSNWTVSHKTENSNRMSGKKGKSCANDSSRNVNPELKVKDFSAYYLSGPKGCFGPKYSVTTHTASCFERARESCSPTCSYQNNVQLNSCLQPTVASTFNPYPGCTEQSCTSKRKPTGANTNKRANADAKNNLKLGRKSSYSSLRGTTVPNFTGTQRGKCYYEAYQISYTDLGQKKGVKFFNDNREENIPPTPSRNGKLDCRQNSRNKIYKPMHLIEEASGYCSRTVYHRKPIPSWSIKSFDDAKRPKSGEEENGRYGRVKNFRRILYNEGIDDDLVGRHSVSPRRPRSPPLAHKRSNKDWLCDDVIPYSYTNKSKYHYHCQEEVNKKCYKHDGSGRVDIAENSGVLSTEQIPVILYRAPSIKLPKKILASIRSIDGKTIL